MFKSLLYALDKPAEDNLLKKIEKEPITEKYFTALGGALLAGVGVIGLGIMSIFFYNSQSTIPPATFSVRQIASPPVMNEAGQMVNAPPKIEQKQIISLYSPSHQLSNVTKWLKEALMSTYSFSFTDFDKVTDEAYYYFTADGYKTYLNALNNSELQKSLKEDLMVISLVPVSEPTLINGKRYDDGTTTWMFRTDVIVNYVTGSQTLNDKYQIETLVVQVPPYKSVKGLGIAQYNINKK